MFLSQEGQNSGTIDYQQTSPGARTRGSSRSRSRRSTGSWIRSRGAYRVRFVVAPAFGPRQVEVLGLKNDRGWARRASRCGSARTCG